MRSFCANPALKVYSIDRDYTSLNHAARETRMVGIGVNGSAPGIWTGIEDDAEHHAGAFVDESIDLLLDDLMHSSGRGGAELRAWLPKVRHGAPIWCHDYSHPDLPGSLVPAAIDAMVAEGLMVPGEMRGISWSGRRA